MPSVTRTVGLLISKLTNAPTDKTSNVEASEKREESNDLIAV